MWSSCGIEVSVFVWLRGVDYLCSSLFFKDPAPTGIYTYGHTLARHDALPISPPAVLDDQPGRRERLRAGVAGLPGPLSGADLACGDLGCLQDRKSTRLNSRH